MDDQRKPTLKERARQARREAYQKAKERRARDPRQAAFKEAQRQRQREAYQQAKERRRALIAERQRVQQTDAAPSEPEARPMARRAADPPAVEPPVAKAEQFLATRRRILH